MILLRGLKLDSNLTQKIWDSHYTKSKSQLTYPDENLVRILSKLPKSDDLHSKIKALDLGAGSGRHTILLKNFGFETYAIDYSKESIDMIQSLIPEITAVQINKLPYPLESNSFDLIVSWGMLHYNSTSEIKNILKEIKRILRPNGYFIGTLRSDKDTHLLQTSKDNIQLEDLKGGFVQLFSEIECSNLLNDFNNISLGYMERSPMGKLEQRIAHHIFLCQA